MRTFLRRNLGKARRALTLVSRSRERAPAGRLSALRHPLFLGALALLLVNDHVLKGTKVLPGVLTGKLSDFAGMIVAPVLAAALVHARSNRSRAAAFAAAALPFVAIKLSATAASWMIAAGALVGLKLRVWQDPTDLVALVSLVPAWRLAAAAPSAALAGRPQWVMERAALAVSAAACVATSAVPGPGVYSTDAYLVNGLPFATDVRVRWVDAKLDCPSVMAGDPTRMLGPSAFDLGITFHLEGHATVPLNRAAALRASTGDMGPPTQDPDGKTATGGTCEVALIETDLLPPQLVWWDSLQGANIPPNVDTVRDFWDNPVYKQGQVLLAGNALGTPGKVSHGALQSSIDASGCADTTNETIQWSVPPNQLAPSGTISKIDELPDHCLRLTVSYGAGGGNGGAAGAGGMGGMAGAGGAAGGGMAGAGGAGGGQPEGPSQELYLCIHKDELPFAEGDQITFQAEEGHLFLSGIGNSSALQLWHHVDQVSMAGISAKVAPGTCAGDRLSCGGYVAPAALQVTNGGQITTLNPGDTLPGVNFKLRVGRSEHVLVGREACDSAHQTPGIGADLLISQK
jgi:hypothetical protein